jgi:hypothetical protein
LRHSRWQGWVVILGQLAPWVVFTPSAGFAAELVPTEAHTLNALIAAVEDRIPEEDSEKYVVPAETVLAEIRLAVTAMLNGDPVVLGDSLQAHYAAVDFFDIEDGQVYQVLVETVDGDDDGVSDRGWGTVIINGAGTAIDLCIGIPHPLFDGDTPAQGIDVFKGVNARTFLMSGTHRNANAQLAPVFDSSSYRIGDAAHNVQHGFFAAYQAIYDDYTTSGVDFIAIQLHGMSEASSNGLEVYATHGVTRVPTTGSLVRQLQDQLRSLSVDWDVAVPGDPVTANLSGTLNVEGRLLNGIREDALPHASTYGNHTGWFIHAEQTPTARQTDAYPVWIQALKALDPNGLPEIPGYWVRIPNGGQTWTIGAAETITWDSPGIDDTVHLALFKGDKYYKTISSSTVDDGEFTWSVVDTATAGDDYRVRIRSTADTNIRDYSDLAITLQP